MDNNIIDKRTKYVTANNGLDIHTTDFSFSEIATCFNKAKAAFIVKACNEYESLKQEVDIYKTTSEAWQKGYNQLKEANKELLEALKGVIYHDEQKAAIYDNHYYDYNEGCIMEKSEELTSFLLQAKEAIKKHSPK